MTYVGTSESDSTPSGVNRDQIVSGNAETIIGKVVADRYVVLGLLGSGAMGTVYKARHKHLNREVALKMLRKEAAADENSSKRFENEAKAASSLTHSNLIAVTDYGFTESGTPFLIMDYVQGQSLAYVLKQDKYLSDDRLVNILTQICAGLSHAHDKGLVHRDLKPSNILLTKSEDGKDDFVKIVDFGLAKPIVGTDQDLTHTGQIFGTPLYMSPEQCQGRKLDARSDIYSIGCLMYRMVAGRLPFTGDNPVTTIVMHVKDAPPAIPEDKLGSAFLKSLNSIIMKALEKDPENRFQSAAELRGALLRASSQEPTTESLSAVPDSGPQQSTMVLTREQPSETFNPRPLIIGSLVCFLLVAAIVGTVTWNMLHHHTTEVKRVVTTSPAAQPVEAVVAPIVAPPIPAAAPLMTKPPAKKVTKPVVRANRRAAARKTTTTRPKRKNVFRTLMNNLLN